MFYRDLWNYHNRTYDLNIHIHNSQTRHHPRVSFVWDSHTYLGVLYPNILTLTMVLFSGSSNVRHTHLKNLKNMQTLVEPEKLPLLPLAITGTHNCTCKNTTSWTNQP